MTDRAERKINMAAGVAGVMALAASCVMTFAVAPAVMRSELDAVKRDVETLAQTSREDRERLARIETNVDWLVRNAQSRK